MKNSDDLSTEYTASLYNQTGVFTKGEIETAFVSGRASGIEDCSKKYIEIWNSAIELAACVLDHGGSDDRQQTFQGGADDEVSLTYRTGDILAENIRKLMKG